MRTKIETAADGREYAVKVYDRLDNAEDCVTGGAPPDAQAAAALIAIAHELRTANLLAAAATLGGDAAALCGELAVDRLGGAK